jgi:hypothetical protein
METKLLQNSDPFWPFLVNPVLFWPLIFLAAKFFPWPLLSYAADYSASWQHLWGGGVAQDLSKTQKLPQKVSDGKGLIIYVHCRPMYKISQ